MIDEFVGEPLIAYFSMEMALENDISTYSGGLGVLAGDTLRSASDLDLPMIGVSLVSRKGYFKQEINSDYQQQELSDPWEPTRHTSMLPAKVAVDIEGRKVWISAWLYVMQSPMGHRKPVILLDTDLQENEVEDREITDYLYGGDSRYRLKQEIVLGIGGVRMLRALDIEVREYHMNEGHSALLGVELLRRYAHISRTVMANESRYDLPYVRSRCKFTTHTPVEAGHDKFSYALVNKVMGDRFDETLLKQLAGSDELNMTRLALGISEYVNGVAKKHAEVSHKMFPGYQFHSITNGVHPSTWTNPAFAALYDKYIPGWCHESDLLVRVDQISDEQIWQAHCSAKSALIDLVYMKTGIKLDVSLPVIGFARRMTAYKRPDLLFKDLQRLKNIAGNYPFQLILSGKAHPRDDQGKQLIRELHQIIDEIRNIIPSVFIVDYDMNIAKAMVSGVDIWLNTPLRPYEASGTSGMKASFNGVPNLSVLDGWWIEGCIEGVTGWAIGEEGGESDDDDHIKLYDKLDKTILPLYQTDRQAWIAVMKGAIGKNASYFNSHRMMRRYVTEAYLK